MIIKPSFCPCCGNTDTFVEPDERGSGGQWISPIHVGCSVQTGCGLSLIEDDEETAITAWNTRAVTDEMVERAARALAVEDKIEICSDATYRLSTYGPRARAALTAALGGENG